MLSPRQPFVVSGRLSQPNGSPLVGVIVKAFDKELPSRQPNEKELGQATTDAKGRYEIAYTATQLSRNEKASANLIVRVFNQEGTQLAESPIHFDAPAETTVDLVVVPSQEEQRSESEQLLAKINPILDGAKLANVTDEDITFLIGATGIERERIEFLRKAAQLAQETDLLTTQKTDLPTVVFYGLARQNLPLNRKGLLDLPPETLHQALELAIEMNIIPARLRDSLNDFTRRFNQLRDEQLISATRQVTGQSLNHETGVPLTNSSLEGRSSMAQAETHQTALLSSRTKTFETKAGFNTHINGIAVDSTFIYASYHYTSKVPADPISPEPGVLVVIDSTNHQEISRVQVGYQPRSVAVNPRTKRAYVVNYGKQSYSLSVIDTTTYQEISQIKLGRTPIDVAVNPNTNRIYVTNAYSGIHVIDGDTNTQLASIKLPPQSHGIAVNLTTNTIYVALSKRSQEQPLNALAVIDGATNTVRQIVTVGPINTQPGDVAVNEQTNRIYVANLGANSPDPSTFVPPNITVLNGSSYEIITTVRTKRELRGVAVNPRLNQIYVPTDEGVVEVIDGNTNTVVQILPVGGIQPECIAVRPETNQIYVGSLLRSE